MAITLNDTLDVKRGDIKHYDFGMPFWEATRQKKLVIQYCKTAKKYQHFPRPVSIFTGRKFSSKLTSTPKRLPFHWMPVVTSPSG